MATRSPVVLDERRLDLVADQHQRDPVPVVVEVPIYSIYHISIYIVVEVPIHSIYYISIYNSR